jgi:uncharacterized protein (TIGR01777 family)
MRSLKIVLPGGSGHLGRLLTRAWVEAGHQVVVLSRRPPASAPAGTSFVAWDGRTPGPWMRALDGAVVLVNLAGRSVDCRYDKTNLRAMLDSRVESTRVLGQACAEARVPPRVWLQSSTATLYAHRHDAANDEASGRIGGGEPDAPPYWRWSIDIALAWEAELAAAPTPGTRKVALRTAMVMSGEPASVFDVLVRLARMGLGGTLADGDQYVSWIHARDFVRAVDWLIEREDFSGPVNVCAPGPLPQREFARVLRRAAGVRVGLPATRWMLELGAFLLRTDTELLLKSRRVVPGRMLAAGFRFDFPEWSAAARELVERRRSRHRMPVEVGSSP